MFEEFKKMFGGETEQPKKPEAIQHHYEDSDRFRSGVEAKDIQHETATPEGKIESSEERWERIRKGVEQVIDMFSIPPQSIKAESEFIALKIREQGFVLPKDEQLSGYEGMLQELIEKIQQERMAAVGKSKFV